MISEGSGQTTDVQANPSLHTNFIAGFVLHSLVHELHLALDKIFNRRHFEIFFALFPENRV